MKLHKLLTLFLLVMLFSNAVWAAIPQKRVEDVKFFFGHYPSFEEINRTIHQLASQHPDIVKAFSISKTWGWNPVTQKYDSPRDIWAVKISDNVSIDEDNELSVLLNWHHAREWIGPVFLLYIIQHLVDEYTTNATIHWLVNHYEIYIIPMTNADGYVLDGNGNPNNLSGFGIGGWRKNCRDNNGNGKLDIVDKWNADGEGVDLERNWDWHWSEGDTDPNSSTYHGPAPFSEPETRAERDLIIEKDIDAYAVIHSFSAAILIPWLYTSSNAPHNAFYRILARNMAKLSKIEENASKHFEYGRPDEVIGYSAPGGSPDWIYGKYNKIGIAVEMEPTYQSWMVDGFHPPESKIKLYCEDFYESMIYFIESTTILKSKTNASDQPLPYIVWGYTLDEFGNPIPHTLVSVENNKNGDVISTYSDENGFYMLNLANLHHTFSYSTTFTIFTNDSQHVFGLPSTGGRIHIDLVSGVIPEFGYTSAPILLIFVILGVLYFRREKKNL